MHIDIVHTKKFEIEKKTPLYSIFGNFRFSLRILSSFFLNISSTQLFEWSSQGSSSVIINLQSWSKYELKTPNKLLKN